MICCVNEIVSSIVKISCESAEMSYEVDVVIGLSFQRIGTVCIKHQLDGALLSAGIGKLC